MRGKAEASPPGTEGRAAGTETAPGTGGTGGTGPPPILPRLGPSQAAPCPSMAGLGGPGPPPLPPSPGWGRAGSAGNLVYIAGNEAIGARDFPATCSPPSHPGLAPGLRGSWEGTGTPLPTHSQPSTTSLLPPSLPGTRSALGCLPRARRHGPGADAGAEGARGTAGARCQSRSSPAPSLAVPGPLAQPRCRSGGAPVPLRGCPGAVPGVPRCRGAEGPAGAGQPGGGGPGGCGRRCRRSRGPAPRRGPTGLPSAEAERPRRGQPGRGGARCRSAPKAAGTGGWARNGDRDRGSDRAEGTGVVPGSGSRERGCAKGTEQVRTPAALP